MICEVLCTEMSLTLGLHFPLSPLLEEEEEHSTDTESDSNTKISWCNFPIYTVTEMAISFKEV